MSRTSIRFLHMADTHFGVHYAVRPRNQLRRAYGERFFQKFEKIIDKTISAKKIDFLLHSGDFFNRSKPPPEVVDRAVKPFVKLASSGIPIYIIPGNHERSKLPIGLLNYDENINLFKGPCSFIFEKNGIAIKITGFPYIRHKIRSVFGTAVKKANKNIVNNDKSKPQYSILLLHQLIEGSCIEHFTFKKGNNIIPYNQVLRNKFDYMACGHVHRFQFLYYNSKSTISSSNTNYEVLQTKVNGGWSFSNGRNGQTAKKAPIICYSGSLDRVSMAERNEPKGFILGEMSLSKDSNSIKGVRIKFIEQPSIQMINQTWDFSQDTLRENIKQALTEMTKISKPTQRQHVVRVFRIKIKETGGQSIKPNDLLILKKKAEKNNVYLTFSYPRSKNHTRS